MAFITAIETSFPNYTVSMETARDQLAPLFIKDGEKEELIHGIFANARVNQRYTAKPVDFYFEHQDLTTRNAAYAECAKEIGEKAVLQVLDTCQLEARDIDVIISTSCTGLMIPSLDAYLVNSLGMRRDVRRIQRTGLTVVGALTFGEQVL